MKHETVCGLDIGTTKTCAVVAVEGPNGLEIVGVGEAPSLGMRKGVVVDLEETIKSIKGLQPNVDFYSASAYYSLGIPIDLYTPIFAVSRISGWTAHVLEQYANNRLIRPLADYTGPTNQKYVPIDRR